MKTFVTRTCPLCSKKLKVGDEDSTFDFYCEEFFLRGYSSLLDALLSHSHDFYHQGFYKEPHYSVNVSNGVWRQSTVIPPYWIISTSDSQKTQIFKFGTNIKADQTNLLLEVPIIVPSDYLPEDFARKIKNLVIFS